MRVLMSVLLLSLYFMSASVNTALRDPGITHLLQHHCPRVSRHGPSHGHSGPKTGIFNSYTSFMVFPLCFPVFHTTHFFTMWPFCSLTFCRVNHSKIFALQFIVVHPYCFAFRLFSNTRSAICFCSSLSVSVVTPYPRNELGGSSTHIDKALCRFLQILARELKFLFIS